MRKTNEKPKRNKTGPEAPRPAAGPSKNFKVEYMNSAQKLAWTAMEQHDITFLLGSPGTGKTFLAMAYAIGEVLAKRKSKIVLTRPIVEAGEKLGFLPGTFDEKVNPYMFPLYDCLEQCLGISGGQREAINKAIEVAPIAFMRGRTFKNAICIFDEAQNATTSQLKLFLTRLGKDSKMLITGDPFQSDLPGPVALSGVVDKIGCVPGIAVVEFKPCSIVRHALVGAILEKLGQ